MNTEQISNLNLGISPIDARTEITINAGIDWLERNTDLNLSDPAAFPNNAKLFLIKFFDLMMMQAGVTSQSIEGLSQSFNTGDIENTLFQFAEELFGDNLTKGRVRFVQAGKKWA